MNTTISKIIRLSVLLVAATLVVTGCTSPEKKSAKYNWTLSITKKTTSSIQVDLVGVTELEKPVWESYSMDKYWSEGDKRREDADQLTSSLDLNVPWIVDRKNPIWKKWKARGVDYVLILAHLPGKPDSGIGDPRRVFVSLHPIWKRNTIEFEIYDTEILPMTPRL